VSIKVMVFDYVGFVALTKYRTLRENLCSIRLLFVSLYGLLFTQSIGL
jgi:hypothetical protein